MNPLCFDILKAANQHAHDVAFEDPACTRTFAEAIDIAQHAARDLVSGRPVAVIDRPSTGFGLACLSALLADCPILPVDPALPAESINQVLDLLGAPVAITAARHWDGLRPETRKICLRSGTTDTGQISRVPVKDPICAQPILFYAMTSGTTGKPKCIPVTLSSAIESYKWRHRYLPYTPGDRIGIHIFAIWEMLRPLQKGASVVFPSKEQMLHPRQFSTFLKAQQLREMLFTPSFLERALDSLLQDADRHVALPRRVILNGEAVTGRLLDKIRKASPGTAIWNLYSACETHDVCVQNLTCRDSYSGAAIQPTGRVMPELCPHILDAGDRPCPLGKVGEIHLSGDKMIGPGYVGRPLETADRFRVLAVKGTSCRTYATGDQGYLTADGKLVVLGRMSHVLKLNGHSIQTTDLTATLAKHLRFLSGFPWIQKDATNAQKLVFYYTATADQCDTNTAQYDLLNSSEHTPLDLRAVLSRHLPDHCIPDHLVRLPELPISNVSGKCDPKKLPNPYGEPTQRSCKTALKKDVRSIWAQLLRRPREAIDMSNSLAANGADSLMQMEAVLEIENHFRREVPFTWMNDMSGSDIVAALQSRARTDLDLASSFKAEGVLITGATGFVGSGVLPHLLRALPESQVVYCLVRPESMKKFAACVKELSPNHKGNKRLVPVPGNISQTSLGLNDADYQELANKVTTVLHSAALVNLALPHELLENSIVHGTEHVTQFACSANAPLVFVSSSSVFPDRGGPFAESETHVFDGISGYGSAKIAAENSIMRQCDAATIVRIPSLHDPRTPNRDDIYERIGASILQMELWPRNLRFQMLQRDPFCAFLARILANGSAHGILNVFTNVFIRNGKRHGADRMREVSDSYWISRSRLPRDTKKALRAQNLFQADALFETAQARKTWASLTGRPYSDLEVRETDLFPSQLVTMS